MEQLYELAPEQIEVCLRVNGAAGRCELTHQLRPPAFEDWRAYERDLRSTVEVAEEEPEALEFVSSTLEAAGALYDRLFRKADGYKLPDTGSGITAEQIPIHHKEAVIRSLTEVAPAPPESVLDESGQPALFLLDAERNEAVLQASRGGVLCPRLVHVFRSPTAADRVEYSRITSQALYVRNSQTLKTILPSRLPGLVALYDRLVDEVRGYVAAGIPVTDRAAIVKQMDCLHKKVAVQVLFGE